MKKFFAIARLVCVIVKLGVLLEKAVLLAIEIADKVANCLVKSYAFKLRVQFC